MSLRDAHLDYCEGLNLATTTVGRRRSVLATLPCDVPTRDEFDRWWTGRRHRIDGAGPRAPRSMTVDLSHVRSYERWLKRYEHIPVEFTTRAELPRLPRSRPQPIRDHDLDLVFRSATPLMARMLGLAAFAGLRSMEIANLRWDDLSERTLWVRHGKGDKDRPVMLTKVLAALLGEPGEGHVCLADGRPLTAKQVSARIAYHLDRCGVESTAHKLRARYATRYQVAARDLVSTANALGHASTSTTGLYVLAADDSAWRGAEAASMIGGAPFQLGDDRQPACTLWEPLAADADVPSFTSPLVFWHDGRCGICGWKDHGLVQDHDHATGKVRGLLCRSCNTAEAHSSAARFTAWRNGVNTAAILGVDEDYQHMIPGQAVLERAARGRPVDDTQADVIAAAVAR